MIFHEKTWGQDGDQVGTKLSTETLGAIWFKDISAPKPYAQYDFGEPEAPKPKAQYDLGNQRRRNLTHSMIWDPEAPQTYVFLAYGIIVEFIS